MSSLLRPDLSDYSGASNLAFNEEIKHMMDEGTTIYHFGFGQSPFPVIEVAVEALKKNAGQNAYLPVSGIPALRNEICSFHARYDGLLNLDPDNVLVGPGSKELIFLLLNVFNGNVLLLSPSWTTYKPQCLLSRHNPVIIEVHLDNQWKVTPDKIEQAVTGMEGNKLMILTNPDNPTGAVYSESELRALSDTFRKHKIIVLSDEIYARLNYKQNHASLVKYYPEGTILCTGMSKWASAGGWRLGYHIYPKELSTLKVAVKSAGSHTFSCAPTPMQFAFAQMLKDTDACENYIKHTSRIMAAVSEFCCRELQSVGMKLAPPSAGYYVFPDFVVIADKLAKRGVTTCQQMCALMLKEASVALMAGGPYYLRPPEELTTRLCFVNFDGTDALDFSRKLGLSEPLPESFVKDFCLPVHDGILNLKSWVQKQLKDY
ncbi:aspartate aminotransferase-like [Gigantopelta aegis]|uniref:aspartate aminotransferase-like n=1 Tax=Gigantopelta aegis TaxID=1735272 RepID=UPI001B88D705|nr:aspartate aminotransferase-like [Gigantopelta aegis]